jgi:hypothetical protein
MIDQDNHATCNNYVWSEQPMPYAFSHESLQKKLEVCEHLLNKHQTWELELVKVSKILEGKSWDC